MNTNIKRANFISQTVADYYGLPVEKMYSKTRVREIKDARQIAQTLIYIECNMNVPEKYKISLEKIGKLTGGRCHATVIHAIKTIKNLRETDSVLRRCFDDIDDLISGKVISVLPDDVVNWKLFEKLTDENKNFVINKLTEMTANETT